MYKNKQHIFFPIILWVVLLCTSCNGSNRNKEKTVYGPVKDSMMVYKKPSSGFTDTLLVNMRAAIFFEPGPAQLGNIKKIMPEMNFKSSQHDCYYQQRNARMVIGKYWPDLPVIEASKARYLLFLKANKTQTIMDLDKLGDMCGIILFDGEKDPEQVDMMNIDTALGFYFEK